MTITDLPTLNAFLNLTTLILLISGYLQIKQGKRITHRNRMLSALFVSTLFMISYLYYHYHAGSTKYPYYDWTRPLYFSILIPHIIFAALILPSIGIVVYLAFSDRLTLHKKIARFILPVWIFVSMSGILIYLMLYRL